jgi:hypothetical protein
MINPPAANPVTVTVFAVASDADVPVAVEAAAVA